MCVRTVLSSPSCARSAVLASSTGRHSFACMLCSAMKHRTQSSVPSLRQYRSRGLRCLSAMCAYETMSSQTRRCTHTHHRESASARSRPHRPPRACGTGTSWRCAWRPCMAGTGAPGRTCRTARPSPDKTVSIHRYTGAQMHAPPRSCHRHGACAGATGGAPWHASPATTHARSRNILDEQIQLHVAPQTLLPMLLLSAESLRDRPTCRWGTRRTVHRTRS